MGYSKGTWASSYSCSCNQNFPIGLLCEFKEIKRGENLAQCLVHEKCSGNTGAPTSNHHHPQLSSSTTTTILTFILLLINHPHPPHYHHHHHHLHPRQSSSTIFIPPTTTTTTTIYILISHHHQLSSSSSSTILPLLIRIPHLSPSFLRETQLKKRQQFSLKEHRAARSFRPRFTGHPCYSPAVLPWAGYYTSLTSVYPPVNREENTSPHGVVSGNQNYGIKGSKSISAYN